MLRYETLFLAVPEITADESSAIEAQFDKIINDAKGTVKLYDRWGKYRLAYPIRNFDYGIYFLAKFEVDEKNKNNLLETIRNLFAVKNVDLVMRHIVKKIDAEGSLEYKRPESLEEAPTRDVDTFLKENKMGGLLNKTVPSSNLAKDEMEEIEELDQ